MAAPTTATRTRSGSSRSSTPTSPTSRTAGRARTTSSSGYDWKRDRRDFFRDQPFDIFYRDLAEAITQVDIYNSNTQPVNDVTYNSVWANDTWKVSDRLTLNLGLRFEAYKDGWGDQEFAPNGLPQLANWPADYRPAERQRYFDFIAPQTVGAVTVADTKTLSPRVGFAYDLTGDNRTVLKAYFGQTRFNSADLLADQENPVGLAQLRYGFVPCTATVTTQCDLNGNLLLDSPQELGTFNSTQGGGGSVRVDRDMVRPVANELSVNLEREIRSGLSGRASYVYKNQREMLGRVRHHPRAAVHGAVHHQRPWSGQQPRDAGRQPDAANLRPARRGHSAGSRVHERR